MSRLGSDAPREGGPTVRPQDQAFSQYGSVEVLLSRQVLAGVVTLSLPALAERLHLQIETSFTARRTCEFAYLETEVDAFTILQGASASDVEIWAFVGPIRHGDEPTEIVGTAEFRRFASLAGLKDHEIVLPR